MPIQEYVLPVGYHVCRALTNYDCRLGVTLITTFTMEFQKHIFSSLPPSFPPAYKKLCQSTVGAPVDLKLWGDFERLGLLDRFESLIASVGYEQIERRVAETCPGNWNGPMLKNLRDWSSQKIVPWMVLPFARGARTSECLLHLLHYIHTTDGICLFFDVLMIQTKKRVVCFPVLAPALTTTSVNLCAT